MFDLLIKGGNVVFHDGVRKVDIGVKDEKISCIAEHITEDAKEVIDAAGQFVMPGMIDTHVHISEPGRTEWEGFETGSKSMAAGGTTSYVEMPLNALPATINKEALDLKLEAAKTQNYVDYAFYGGLVPDNLDKLEELDAAGVLAFKCFLSDITSDIPGDFTNVDDYTLYKGMQKLAELDQLLCIHAENPSVTKKLAEDMVREGRTTAMDYVESRPIFTEVEAVSRAILFAKETGCKLHLVHISTSEAVQVIVKAQQEGVDVTLETCPHYLAITAEQVEEIGPRAKCQPPLRKAKDQERLWDELMKGNINWITSDHSPCTENLKQGNIFEAWGGISGVQNNVDLMFDLAVKQRGLPVNKFVDLIATHPSERFNLPNKGEIAVGKDADIIFVDPNQSYVVKREDLYYKNKFSAYEGRQIDCRVTKTIVRGNVVFDLNEGIVGEPIGKLMAAQK
ncbi:allantoinase AllB [Rummeliibacillus stabekisii]|uniref:allantoinase AllB n=1 Tax=Rummeliibacillus stabekisii TaxID=241244 RepID=UPI00116B068F|nr:allantoinase AllB [Rummeliibacillus stabekisii]MBB5169350.1 allantoinase [Rummeliibacillus stabekisii]GEL03613.1 allantoinase [Rummeliibacillus stabekisii]